MIVMCSDKRNHLQTFQAIVMHYYALCRMHRAGWMQVKLASLSITQCAYNRTFSAYFRLSLTEL
jgi:hypothetical protein